MAWGKSIFALIMIGPLTSCADPNVWSAVAPAYRDGIALSPRHDRRQCFAGA